MARRPFRIARQEHLGDALDDLQRRGQLTWKWSYDDERHRAIFVVRMRGHQWPPLDTRSAEELVAAEYKALGVPWRPVPHPGGEDQREPVTEWIAEERARLGM